MEWPAEARAEKPVTVRLLVRAPCMDDPEFRPGVSVQDDQVTFDPQFVGDGSGVCVDRAIAVLIVWDTSGRTPPLAPRTYSMGAVLGYRPDDPSTLGGLVVSEITSEVDRVNAGGRATLGQVQGSSCIHLSRGELGLQVVVENPPPVWRNPGLARGYLHTVATPLCGATRVFHLESFEALN